MPGVIEVCLIILVAALIIGLIALYTYIYGDAKRRNMNAVMWTLLAIFTPSGIGIILYFLLREPVAVFCIRCGVAAQAGFAHCPGCGIALSTACPHCHRVPQAGWTHCAACGANLARPPAPAPGS